MLEHRLTYGFYRTRNGLLRKSVHVFLEPNVEYPVVTIDPQENAGRDIYLYNFEGQHFSRDPDLDLVEFLGASHAMDIDAGFCPACLNQCGGE